MKTIHRDINPKLKNVLLGMVQVDVLKKYSIEQIEEVFGLKKISNKDQSKEFYELGLKLREGKEQDFITS
jgi:hypothetical protein